MPNAVEFNPLARDGSPNEGRACQVRKADSRRDRMADRSDALSHRRDRPYRRDKAEPGAADGSGGSAAGSAA